MPLPHTPGEWRFNTSLTAIYAGIVNADGQYKTRAQVFPFYNHDPKDKKTQDDARFLIQACNNFDELLDTLKSAQARHFMQNGKDDLYDRMTAIINKAEAPQKP